MSKLNNKNVLVTGATSYIAQSTLRLLAEDECSFLLIGRNKAKLEAVASDLLARGANKAECYVAEVEDLKSKAAEIVKHADTAMAGIDIAFLAHGTLGSQKDAILDSKHAEDVFQVNFISMLHMLTELANYFTVKKAGTIAVIGSVAGDRGRQSNYVYGSSKAALSAFLEGLRGRLFRYKINVLDIRPGFVDTPMTGHLAKNILFASPQKVGRDIYKAILKKKDILYTPCYWCFIMLIVKLIPECIFKRLKL